MRYSIERIRQRATARGPFVALGLLALALACQRDDPLPTGPPLAVPAAPVAAVVGAQIIDIGFDGVAINESGQVAGTMGSRAALYTPNHGVDDLGTLGGTISVAYALNELGQVAGYSTTATGARHAFLWTPGAGMQDLGVLDGGTSATARGINDLGHVVGEVTLPPVGPRRPAKHAFLWTSGHGMQDLGTLRQDLTSSIAYDINNAEQVVGRAFSTDKDWEVLPPGDPEFFSRAFLWAPGQGMRDLGDLGGGHSIAHAINDAGQVVGRSFLSPFSISYHAFRWTSEEGMRDLGAFGPARDSSSALGINEAGAVVGWSTVGVGPYYGINAFIWTALGGLEDLTPTTGIPRARGINNQQQIVGYWRVATVHLGPGNIAPVARPGGPYTGSEGSEVQFNPSGTDLDGGELYGHVFFGDGSDDIIDTMLPYAWRAPRHVYADNGTYTLTLIVSDSRGGRDTATTTVTIANVAPTILARSLTGPSAPIQLIHGSASVPIAFEFRDPAGRHDTYAAEVACGNGVIVRETDLPVSNTITNGVYVGTGTYAGVCTYAHAGVYTVRATVSDDDGGTSAPAFYSYVIVFDPAGGSVAGSGFYSIPGQGNRKAHFTFDASFPNHGTVPNGSVKAWIPGGDMNFESSGVEMLVVSGNRAQMWGTGTLNGAPARFRITGTDGLADGHGAGADAIRIELWDATGATLLYDTQPGAAQDAPVTTPNEGGNIRIRND